jgi:hypothetical protein
MGLAMRGSAHSDTDQSVGRLPALMRYRPDSAVLSDVQYSLMFNTLLQISGESKYIGGGILGTVLLVLLIVYLARRV